MRYLPGVKLGENVVADPDVESAGNPIIFVQCYLLFGDL